MRSVHNFADRSAARPSLLMRYMSAIGGGVVVVRGGPNDIRYDGTSQEILRSKLDNYAFLPVPNSHFKAADEPIIKELNSKFEKGLNADEESHLAFYKKYNMNGVKLICDWVADIVARETPEKYPTWIRSKYQLAETTPLIFCGSPEGFQGWPSLTDDEVRTRRPGHPTELFEILDDCGYAKRFRLVGYEAGKDKRGVHDFQREQHWKVDPNFKDVGLIYLSRTSKGRTVLVIAGCSHPYGTFSGVRICADHGRTELNHLVEQFINGKVDSVAVPFSCAPAIPGDSEDWITPGSPVHAVLHIDPVSNYSELAIRELEDRVAKLQPNTNSSHIERSTLAQYFSEKNNQGLSALAKSYPIDQRDDATSHDLLLSLLPNTRIYPVPASHPWNVEGEIGLPNEFQSQLKSFIANYGGDQSEPASENPQTPPETLLQSLVRLDASSYKKFRDWKEIGDAKAKNEPFHKWVESQYYFPSSNLLIVGSPESHLGYVPPNEWKNYKDEQLPQLSRLLKHIGYPNRFELRGSNAKVSRIYDRKSMTMLSYPVLDGGPDYPDYSVDVGLIYLHRDPDGQIIVIVGGNGWLGTLAGIQLLFAERRASVDAAIQAFLNGERKSVDIAYSCRRIEPSKRAVGKKSDSETQTKEQQNEETHKPFAISHPSVELDVQLIGEDQLQEYKWSSDAEELYRPLFEQLESKTPIQDNGNAHKPPPLGDASIFMDLAKEKGDLKLYMTCKNVLQINAKHIVFFSEPTLKTYKQLKVDAIDAWEEIKSASSCCRRFLVVGPTGVGKEGAAIFLHNLRDANCKKFEQLNMAAFSEDLVGSDLFGHATGYFTGADKERIGIFELCKDEGMVVLDEFLAGMESLQKTLQPMLLRVLEDAFVVKMGDDQRTPVDLNVFVFATTNEYPTLKELYQAASDKRVRGDLIARFPNRYELLPISKRPLEILPSFLWTLHKTSNKDQSQPASIVTKITVDALKLLLHFNYPENFRQLNYAATQIAKSTNYKTDKKISKEMVLNSLGIRIESANSTSIEPDSSKTIEVNFSWTNFETDTVASGKEELQNCILKPISLEWPKKGATVHRRYEDFLFYILCNLCCPKQREKYPAIGENIKTFVKRKEEATDSDWKSLAEIATAFLSKKDNVKLAVELQKWMGCASDELRGSFRYFEDLGRRIFSNLESLPEMQRAMITWLLTGVYYRKDQP